MFGLIDIPCVNPYMVPRSLGQHGMGDLGKIGQIRNHLIGWYRLRDSLALKAQDPTFRIATRPKRTFPLGFDCGHTVDELSVEFRFFCRACFQCC